MGRTTRMKLRYKTVIKVIVVLGVGLWVLSIVPFNQNIKQEISANIYENEVVTGETTVFIDGEKSNYLLRADDSFHGKFHILSYEKTGRDGMSASIKWGWDDEVNIQKLTYFQNGTFPSMDVIRTMIISENMTQFALMFTDGTVVATSDEIYELYTQHISYDPDTGSTSIDAANKIPKI